VTSCPGCGLELRGGDVLAEIEHMQTEHPEIIRTRLRAIAELPPASEPLTPALLRARVVVLNERVLAEAGRSPEDVVGEEKLIERVVCDRCARWVDLRFGDFPEGWTTEGDFEHGFTDLCRGCSQ
jgi:hypothetical protein